jgi:hypothetical protein
MSILFEILPHCQKFKSKRHGILTPKFHNECKFGGMIKKGEWHGYCNIVNEVEYDQVLFHGGRGHYYVKELCYGW